MAVMDIVHYGDPILRKKCKHVQQFDGIDRLIADMFDTMYEADGIGLAANQVGLDLHLFIIDISHTEEADEPFIFINGDIIDSEGECEYDEGCLSIPGVTLNVVRPEAIDLKYQTEKGEWKKHTFTGLAARAIQHEIDHLNGVYIVDRVQEIDRMSVKSKLKEIEAQAKEEQKTRQTLQGYKF
ncbi:MAG: peptide deformylase [Candidatus Marinimicrobia bacterium]|nr:peptide deformylase [Candidatus Neomarinimicrobiota bacterium]